MIITLTERDSVVIATITKIRAKYHACTATAIANEMRISKAYLHEILWDMIERGIVAFNPEMPGSVRVTDRVGEALPAEAPTGEQRAVCHEAGCQWPTQQALESHLQRAHQMNRAQVLEAIAAGDRSTDRTAAD